MKSSGMRYNTIFIVLIWFFLFLVVVKGEESHPNVIVSKILTSKKSILQHASQSSQDQYIFLAFWDFDGTILKGDCSEGFEDNGHLAYKGLAQLLIESGYSKLYPSKDGTTEFLNDYHHMESLGKWLAYPYVLQIFRGAAYSDIEALSKNYFETVLRQYYFSASLEILKALEKNEIKSYVLSASAEMFVKASASTLGLPEERFHGIKQKIKNDRLTEEIVYPITWSEGKVEKLNQIVDEVSKQNPDKKVVILAAFGNSYTTDGPFMQYVKMQKLPNAAKPTVVMINGGETPATYKNLFIKVNQSEILGAY
jgi:phosphoserine phosphatase